MPWALSRSAGLRQCLSDVLCVAESGGPEDVMDAGAHDLAPNDKIGGFRHWRSLGMEPPKVDLSDDLSHLDEVVKAIHQQLRLKGMDL